MNGYLRFAQQVLLQQYSSSLGQKSADYQVAVDACVKMLDVCHTHRRKMPPRVTQEFCDSASLHLKAVQRLELGLRPKHHQLLEMGARPAIF